MHKDETFGESIGALCSTLIIDVGNIVHDNEEKRALIEQEIQERTEMFEKHFALMADD